MTAYVALLRAINLPGHNRIAMAELRDALAPTSLREVTTHLASGNVVAASDGGPAEVAPAIRKAIADRFDLEVEVMVRSAADLDALLAGFPYPDGDPRRTGVAFLSGVYDGELDASAFAPDECAVAGADVYLHCRSGFGTTKLTNAWIEKQTGLYSTSRNWNTVVRLAEMADDLDA